MHAVVIGGGLAGLSAALELSLNGCTVNLFEKKPIVGGLSRSISFGPFIYDIGPHVLHTDSNESISFFKTMLESSLQLLKIYSKTYISGKLHNFPPTITNLKYFPLPVAIKTLKNLIKNKFFRKIDHNSLDSFENLFDNDVFYNAYYKTFTRKFWGISPNLLETGWVQKRIFPRFFHSPLMGKRWQGYPKNGIGELPKRMAKLLMSKGVKINLNCEVVAYLIKDNVVKSVSVCTPGIGMNDVQCDILITTQALPDIITMLGYENMPQLKYRSLIYVFITLLKENVLKDIHSVYFPDSITVFTRIYEPKRYSLNCSPEDKSSLVVEIPCSYGEGLWGEEDQKIISIVINQLIDHNIIKLEDVGDCVVQKEKYAYPLPSHVNKRNVVHSLNNINLQNMEVCGRFGLFSYLNMDESIQSGRSAAKRIFRRYSNR